MYEYVNATLCCEKGEEDMKRKKLALMLAMSLTFTSFSGAGWPVYAEELPEIVEDEAEDADAAEYVEPEEEQPIALEEETDAASGDAEADTAEQQPNENETDAAALYGDFVELVEVVDEAEAPAVYSEDGGLSIEDDDWDEFYAYPDETVELSVTASTVYGKLEYRWYELSGESDDEEDQQQTLISTEAKCKVPAKEAAYKCVVSNGYSEQTIERNVHLYSGLQIKKDYKSYSARVGEKIMLSVEASTEIGTLTYQWYKEEEFEDENGQSDSRKVLIDGANGPTCEVTADTVNNEYGIDDQYYYCLISDGYTSKEATCNISVKADNYIYITVENKEWNSVYVKLNGSKTLSVTASTNSGTLSYQWYRDEGVDVDDTAIVGATTSEMELSNVTQDARYYCEISNGDLKERVYYSVYVDTGLSVKEEYYQYKYILPGETTTLSVHASTPIGSLTYEWQGEDTGVLGTSASIVVNKAGEYYCKIGNGYDNIWVSYVVEEDPGVELISQGGDVQVPYGQSVVLKAEARTVYGTLTYNWYDEDYNWCGSGETLEIPWKALKGRREQYICRINNKEFPYYEDDEKIATFFVTMEAKEGLVLEAPEYVPVKYGGSTTLSVNVKTEKPENLKYYWYIDKYWNGDFSFVSRADTLRLDNVTEVSKYECRVYNGTESNWIDMYVGPEDQVELCTDDRVHAKILTPDNQPCSVLKPGSHAAYFSFTPDKSGNWLIYSLTDGDSGFVYLEDSGQKTLAKDDRDGGSFSLGTELQAGKTYYLRCDPFRSGKLTFCAKYLDSDTHEHVWNSGTITKRPTCVETGVKTYTCLECQVTYTEEIPATGAHTMTTVVDQAATCGAAGSQHCECTVCHTKEASTSIPATGAHTMATVVDRAATCGAAGSQHRECTVCHTREASTSIPATGAHKFGAYAVTQQSTVLATGTQARTCSVCGKTESTSIPKLSGTMTLKANSIPLQLKKTIELRNVVTGLMAGDSIVSCSSNNTKVATVSPTGKVTAKKAGKTTITITLASGVSQSVVINVQKGAVKTSKISGVVSKVTLEAGKSLALSPVVTPLTTKDKLSYSSSNKKVATVSKSGVITAKASGKAKITIKSGRKKFVVTVTVPKKAPTDMQGVPATKSLKKGKSFTIKAKLLPTGAEAKITYKSSNKKVATVNAKGKVTAKKAGTAVITVTAGGIKQTCTVTVK